MPETAKEIPFPALKHFLVRRTAYQTAQLYGWRALPLLHREEVLKVAIELARTASITKSDCQTSRQLRN